MKENPFVKLPYELIQYICDFCSPEDIVALARCNIFLENCLTNDLFWLHLQKIYFPEKAFTLDKNLITQRQLFINEYTQLSPEIRKLFAASQRNDLAYLKANLNYKDVNIIRDNRNRTLLQRLIKNKQQSILDHLFQQASNDYKPIKLESLTTFAAKFNQLDIIKSALEKEHAYIIVKACFYGHLEQVRMALPYLDKTITSFIYNLCTNAATNGEFEILHLIKKETGYELDPAELLYYALLAGHMESVQEAVAVGHIKISDYRSGLGESALLLACDSGNIELISYLQAQGCQLDTVDNTGDHPLLRACRNNDARLAKFLIEQGVDINLTTELNRMPVLFYAGRCNNIPLMDYLLAHGASVSSYPHPLFFTKFVEEGGNAQALARLIQITGSIATTDGVSLLMCCIFQNKLDSLKVILSAYPAYRNISLSNDFTLLTYAIYTNKKEIINYLVTEGASLSDYQAIQCERFAQFGIEKNYCLGMEYYKLLKFKHECAASAKVYENPTTFFAAHTLLRVAEEKVPVTYLEQYKEAIADTPILKDYCKKSGYK